MTTQTGFRCYYDDGTIEVADVCLPQNQYGAALVKAEATIIEDVISEIGFPWLIVILGLIYALSKKGR